MYTITLANGTVLHNIELNGNNFISKTRVDKDVLSPSNLTKMTIDNGERSENYKNMTLINYWNEQDGTHMIFREMTEYERKMEELNAKLEYLSMMTDISL